MLQNILALKGMYLIGSSTLKLNRAISDYDFIYLGELKDLLNILNGIDYEISNFITFNYEGFDYEISYGEQNTIFFGLLGITESIFLEKYNHKIGTDFTLFYKSIFKRDKDLKDIETHNDIFVSEMNY